MEAEMNESYYDYSVFEDYDVRLIPSIPTEELVGPILVYSITFVTGLLGNILILVAVGSQKKVRQTPINVFLASLATADLLLLLICLPLKMLKLFSYVWQFGWLLCKLTHYSETLSVICSVLNLTALSVERYYAVVHPLKAHYLCTTSQAKKVTVLVWLLASILAVPTAVVRVHLPVQDGGKYYCVLDWDRPWLFQSHEIYLLVTVLLVPGTLMLVSYVSMIFQLHRINMERRSLIINMAAIPLAYKYQSSRVEGSQSADLTSRQTAEIRTSSPDSKKIQEPQIPMEFDGTPEKYPSHREYINHNGHKQRRHSDFIGFSKDDHDQTHDKDIQSSPSEMLLIREKETKQVIHMLILVMFLFFLCWTPILIFNVLAAFDILGEGNYGGTASSTKHIKTFFSLLSYINSCLNPIIYGFMSKHFRRSFKRSIRFKPQEFDKNETKMKSTNGEGPEVSSRARKKLTYMRQESHSI